MSPLCYALRIWSECLHLFGSFSFSFLYFGIVVLNKIIIDYSQLISNTHSWNNCFKNISSLEHQLDVRSGRRTDMNYARELP